MKISDDTLSQRIRTLAMRQLDESLSPSEHEELEKLLRENAGARQAYVEYFQDTACLRWLCLEELSGAIEPMKSLRADTAARGVRRVHPWVFWGSIACLLALVTAGLFSNFQKSSSANAERAKVDLAAKNAE